jgi:AcrR family transcriptional regulator
MASVSRAHPRRDDLLAAAIEAVRREGPGVSMDDIAASAGVTKPTLYRAFGSKRGLYEAIASWYVNQILLGVIELIDPQMELRGFIQAELDGILSRVENEVNLYNFLMRRARMELSSDEGGTDFLHSLGDTATLLFRQRMLEVELDSEVAPIWGHGVVGMINSVADWWVENQQVDREEVVEALTDLLWSGFGRFEGLGDQYGRDSVVLRYRPD